MNRMLPAGLVLLHLTGCLPGSRNWVLRATVKDPKKVAVVSYYGAVGSEDKPEVVIPVGGLGNPLQQAADGSFLHDHTYGRGPQPPPAQAVERLTDGRVIQTWPNLNVRWSGGWTYIPQFRKMPVSNWCRDEAGQPKVTLPLPQPRAETNGNVRTTFHYWARIELANLRRLEAIGTIGSSTFLIGAGVVTTALGGLWLSRYDTVNGWSIAAGALTAIGLSGIVSGILDRSEPPTVVETLYAAP